MAVNIGPRIGIEGEAEYRKSIQNIIEQQKTLKTEMGKLESAWDKETSALTKNKQTRDTLNKQIDVQKQRVTELKTMLDASEKATGENSTQTLKWKQAVNEAEAELNRLNTALKDVPNGMQTVGNAMQASGDKITSVGKAFAPVSAAAAAGLTASAKSASDFEDAMAKVSTIADTSAVPVDELRAQILALSNETGVAATDIAGNVYDAISAGQQTEDAVSFVSNAVELSRAGFTSSASALDILTTAMNAYGLSADEVGRVSDVLITTQNLGKTTVDQLAASMGKVIPTAKTNGVSIENLASAYAVMTANGVGTAETTTYLNSMLNELGKNGSSAAKAFAEGTKDIKDGGLTMAEAMESGWELTDVLSVLDDQAAKSGTTINNMFGSAEAGKAANILWDQASKLNDVVEDMGNSAGATQTAYEKLDTTSLTVEKSLNQVKNSGIELGTTLLTTAAPVIDKISTAITNITTAFNSLDDDTKEMIVTVGLAVAALAPVLIVGGQIITGVGKVITTIGGIPGKISAISTTFATLKTAAAPIMSAIGGFATTAAPFLLAGAAIVGVGYLIYKNWDTIKEKAAELKEAITKKWEEIKTNVSTAVETLKTGVVTKWESLKTTVMTAVENLKTSITTKWEEIKTNISTAVENVKTAVMTKWEEIKASVSTAIENLKTTVTTKWEEIKTTVTTAVDNLKTSISTKWEEIKAAVATAVENLKTAVTTRWESIKTAVSTAVENLVTTLSTKWENIKTTVSTAVETIKTKVTTTWDNIKSAVETAVENLKTAIATKWESIKTSVTTVVENVKTKVTTAWDNIKTAVSTAVENLKTTVTTKWEGIKTTLSTVVDNIKTKISTTWDSIKTSVTTTVGNIVTTVTDKFNEIKTNIETKIEAAKNAVKTAIDAIKGFFNFEWKLPDLKMPHFSIDGEFSLMPPKVPHIKVDWYAKAMDGGMILKHPTIFGAAGGNLLGGGEAGAEVVVGANSLARMITSSVREAVVPNVNYGGTVINVYGAQGQDVRVLAREVASYIDSDVRAHSAVW